ncbi:MAG: YmdB family metallophosphoesterase [Spirochaetaceae bacterium]|nr:YmdB family metallophosphoesterase [Spirochaetaceae bacterium]
MRILFLGEIISKSGLEVVKKLLPDLKSEYNINLTLAAANAVSYGYGLTKNHALYLRKLGINILLGNEAIFYRQELELSTLGFVLRPANLPAKATGRGYLIHNVDGVKIGVINMLGMVGYNRTHANNPFPYANDLITNKLKENNFNILIFHSLATAEKQTMGHLLAGSAAAVIGYGTRALSADGGLIDSTAYISDCGRIGSRHSAAGFDAELSAEKFITARPLRNKEATLQPELNAVVLEVNAEGKATGLTTIRRALE